MAKSISQLWKEAYDDEVRRIIRFARFESKSIKVFEVLAAKFSDANPNLFMQANFPPYREWGMKDKNGVWKELKYPFPAMLLGSYSGQHYDKHVKSRGITEAVTRREAITNAVTAGLTRLDSCCSSITDYQRIWDLYTVSIISPYLLLVLPGMRVWIQQQMRKREIGMDEWKVLREKEQVLDTYEGLNIELATLVRQHP